MRVEEALQAIDGLEPVLSVEIDGDARAYPLRIMLFHEIVNDVVGGVPVLVTYCPLCNSGVVFDRRFGVEVVSARRFDPLYSGSSLRCGRPWSA